MSHTPSGGAVPQFDLADRMRKSLRESGIGVQEMADYLGAGRSTVSNWINGRIRPSVQTLRLWSLRCDVDYDWLIGNGCPRRARGGTVTGQGFRTPGRTTHAWVYPAAVAAAALPGGVAAL